jgi:hypothetical protein
VAINDFSNNLFGDTFKNAQSLVKAETTRLANAAALQVSGQNLIDQANFLAASLSQIPVFDAGAPGGAIPGGGIPTGAGALGGADAGGALVPV